jgi:hypothetical protein
MKPTKKSSRPFPKTEKGKAAERVAVAKDVLLQLVSKRLRAKTGEYCYVHEGFLADRLTKDLKTLLADKQCDVCAQGALFVALLDRHNSLTVGQTWIQPDRLPAHVIGQEDFRDYVGRIFEQSQLDLIEEWFEAWGEGYGCEEKPLKWIDKRPHHRLIAIMKNIIAHKGTFEPSNLRY